MTPDFPVRWQRALAAAPAATIYATSGPSVQWLTGLHSSYAAVLVANDQVKLLTDGRYESRAMAQAKLAGFEVQIVRNLDQAAFELLADNAAVAVEYSQLSAAQYQAIKTVLGERRIELADISAELLALRAIKDAYEIERISTACQLSIDALDKTITQIRIGMTELEVARTLELAMGLLGADDRAFPSIVAAGPNSATPHHEPTTRELAKGDILKIDFGALVDGYHADCTRCFVLGQDPTEQQTTVHTAVDQAAQLGRAQLAPGVEYSSVEHKVREFLDGKGLDEYFTHGLGHGVGLEIHEAPALSRLAAGNLVAGHTVTVEPGVYLPNQFGIRIEDTCVVTESGSWILTQYPRELTRIA